MSTVFVPKRKSLIGKSTVEVDKQTGDWAIFSEARVYRYVLSRRLKNYGDDHATIGFVGLNPSTATAFEDDPTIRRCKGFAEDLGFGQMLMFNVFAYRSTDPRKLLGVYDPVAVPDNLAYLRRYAEFCDTIVVAWGAFLDRFPPKIRAETLEAIGSIVMCLGTTKSGQPRHPLYLSKKTKLEVYQCP